MKNTSALRKSLTSLDDQALRSLILTVAGAAGLDSSRAAALAADIPALRATLNGMNDAQLSALLGSLGGDRISNIINGL